MRVPVEFIRPEAIGFSMSPNALAVIEKRYLERDLAGRLTETPAQLFRRVARAVAAARAQWGSSCREAEDEYFALLASGRFLPNSPTLRSAGKETGTLSACFVLPLEDCLEAIMKAAADVAVIHKAGGGTGIDLSELRPRGSRISTCGGTTGGPITFLRMLSGVSAAIQQGGFRQGANMAVMRIDHPDILAFIDLKSDSATMTNYNLSVAVGDDFMRMLREQPDAPHIVVDPHLRRNGYLRRDTDQPAYACGGVGCYTVAELWRRLATRAWENGEPGLIFIDEVNRHNATPHVGAMRATNPCGEQPLLANEACNLGSINLVKFHVPHRAELDFEALEASIRTAVAFLDDVIDVNRYPTPEVGRVCRANRRIGLGVMGFADLLFLKGVPYDSDEAMALAEHIGSFIQKVAHEASAELARQRGAFPNWNGSAWDVLRGQPMRNAAVTTIAPTGTISIIAGCSNGIEPVFSLAFVRQVLDGEVLEEVNPVFLARLAERIKDGAVIDRVCRHALAHGTIQHCEDVPEDIRRVFKTARDIAPEAHVRMQAVWQKHVDAAVSKTINLPADGAVEDVSRACLLAHELRCKGITVYRDGSRKNQPMALVDHHGPGLRTEGPAHQAMKPAALSPAVGIKQQTPLGKLHAQITVDVRSGAEREVFAQLGKSGDLASADLEAICRLISMLLGAGIDLRRIAEQLQGIGSSVSLPSRNGRVMSLPDALGQAMGKYLQAKETFGTRALLLGEADCETIDDLPRARSDGVFSLKCPECSGRLVVEAACATCHKCGFSYC